MTSTNKIFYTITKDGNPVGFHNQNIMCSTCNDGLDKYQPACSYKIESYSFDSDGEVCNSYKTVNLQKWLKDNPAKFTQRKFESGDLVNVTKQTSEVGFKKGFIGKGEIIKRFTGMFTNTYTVKLISGVILEDIYQNEVLPIN
jgi:hypothetical protein